MFTFDIFNYYIGTLFKLICYAYNQSFLAGEVAQNSEGTRAIALLHAVFIRMACLLMQS